MTTLTIAYKLAQKKAGSAYLPGPSLKMLYFIFGAALIATAVFYIFLINQLTLGTYLIKNYNKEISGLQAQNREFEIKLAKTDFMGQILQSAQGLGFEKTEKVKYINVPGNSFALK